ncbi:MAG: TatD family hydrolase [Pseudoxanthomonas suwonensis]|nr:TatD family hydrolase [Pseudoxanthomonas suwonensis]
MPALVDTHCHLDAGEFDPDREAVIARAREAGVTRQVLPAVDARGWPALAALCTEDSGLHPAFGLHPMYLAGHRAEHLTALREWLADHRPVAVGECGLDHYMDDLDPDQQRLYFEAQLRLAREFDLPVIIHARRAVEEVIHTLRRIDGLRGVVHSFPGSLEQAEQLHELGFLLGFGGPVTYERAQRLRRVVAKVPLEQLLLESDAPDQPDAAIRGQRNEPARVRRVLDVVAELRGDTPDAIARATTANAERLFNLPPAPACPHPSQ